MADGTVKVTGGPAVLWADRENPESRYLRGVAWLRVIAVAARVEQMRSVLLATRRLRAQDVAA